MIFDPYAPIPGSPVDLERAARQLAESASRLEAGTERAARAHSSLVLEGWQGAAAERFEEAGSALIGRQRLAAGTLAAIAEALLAFASILEGCQSELHRAISSSAASSAAESLARAAWTRYEAARTQLAETLASGHEQLAGARRPAREATITALPAAAPGQAASPPSALVEFVASSRRRRHRPAFGTGLAPKAVLLPLTPEAEGWELGPAALVRWSRRRRAQGRLVEAATGRVPRPVAGTLGPGSGTDPEAGRPQIS